MTEKPLQATSQVPAPRFVIGHDFRQRVGSPTGSMVNLCPSLPADGRAVGGMANSET